MGETYPGTDDLRRFDREREFLAAHGIVPPSEGFTPDGLARELVQRGWGWKIEPVAGPRGGYLATVEKHWHPSMSRAIVSSGWTAPVAMVFSLAEAIRTDAELAAQGLRVTPGPRH